jgi:hypothetical protein
MLASYHEPGDQTAVAGQFGRHSPECKDGKEMEQRYLFHPKVTWIASLPVPGVKMHVFVGLGA